MQALMQDLRYGVRMLAKKPGFTFVAVITLALGIGASTAIFSVVNALLLRSLPYNNADRLVMIWDRDEKLRFGLENLPVSAYHFLSWREMSQSFDEMSLLSSESLTLTGAGEPERISCTRVSGNFFRLMDIDPIAGRIINNDDDNPGAGKVVVVSYGLWQQRFGLDPELIGKSLRLDGNSYTVIGITPRGFQFPRQKEMPAHAFVASQTYLWVPIALTDEQIERRGDHSFSVIARMKSGITGAQAQAEMNSVAARLQEQDNETNDGFGVNVLSLNEQVVGDVRPALIVLLAAVGFLLLIACANVANLLLARSATRQREVAVRIALGASRWRIIRQLLVEAILLSLMGGVAGVLFNLWGTELLLNLAYNALPRAGEIATDIRVLLFTIALSMATGILCGIVPAVQVSGAAIGEIIKDSARGMTGFGTRRTLGALVTLEFALSLVLLAGAGLMIKSFAYLLELNPGFDPHQVTTASIWLSGAKYSGEQRQAAFFKEAVERIASLPGVESVGATSGLPLSGAENAGSFTIEGKPLPRGTDSPVVDRRVVTPNYFPTMGIPVVRGRDFNEADNATAPGVLIVSESWAQRYLPDEEALGKRVKLGRADSNRPWLTIVGVVGDVKHTSIDSEIRPHVYWPQAQRPTGLMTVAIKSSTDPATIISAVRNEVRAMDQDQPISDVKMMEQYVSDSLSRRRLNMTLLGIFAALALLLASIGIYGVMSYTVTQRTREIGIRIALGANRADVLRLVVGQGMIPAVIGIVLGLGASIALTRAISSLLYGVSATDPLIFTGVAVLLTLVALLASYIPARRAARVDPMVALRYE